jgi:anthranilate/para-aminobenzoate synthase component I
VINPSRDQFRSLARDHTVIPVWRELLADLTTPVAAYARLVGRGTGFLLESVEHGEARWSRWSFIGRNPLATLTARGRAVDVAGWVPPSVPRDRGILAALEALLGAWRAPSLPDLPPLHGGVLGYLGYDVVREVERLPDAPPDDLGHADAVVSVIGQLAAYDHWRQRVVLIDNVVVPDDATEGQLDALYDGAVTRLEQLAADGARPIDEPLVEPPGPDDPLPDVRSTMGTDLFARAVEVAREHILAGDIFQVVLSQRYDFDLDAEPFDVYRVLRQVNPSPYMYFVRQPGPSGRGSGQSGPSGRGSGQSGPSGRGSAQPGPSGRGSGQPGPSGRGSGQSGPSGRGSGQSGPSGRGSAQPGPSGRGSGQPGPSGRGSGQPGRQPGSEGEARGLTLVGASPEPMVRLTDGRVISRPIAGTRRRGTTDEDDARLAAELREHPKEIAEHVMLVDLARNDVGRVVRFGTERVDEYQTLERYSHVMHLTSQVSGELAEGRSAIDVLRATLPAGTVSGAPKVRAMEIIDALEPTKRGPYAGVVGYLDFSGNIDTAIAIRTMVIDDDGRASIQAGAGIVADSVPEHEDLECRNKARALLAAVPAARRMSAARRGRSASPPRVPTGD